MLGEKPSNIQSMSNKEMIVFDFSTRRHVVSFDKASLKVDNTKSCTSILESRILRMMIIKQSVPSSRGL
jgi:hypothetical protein